MAKFGRIFIITCLGIIALCVIAAIVLIATGNMSRIIPGFNWNKANTDNSSATMADSLQDCTFKLSDTVTAKTPYAATFYSAALSSGHSYKDNVDTGKRTFSLSEFKDYNNMTSDFVLHFQMADGSEIPANKVAVNFEVCDGNNKTITPGNFDLIGPGVYAQTLYLGSNNPPKTTGVFRVDAVMKLDGQFYLIARDNIAIIP